MFGFIKKLFSGIAAFFGGLFGGKKSQDDTSKALKPKKSKGFYLELDEIENAKVAIQENIAEPLKAAAGTIAQKLEPAKETVGVAIADRLKAEPAPEAKKSAPEAKKSAPEAKKSKSNKIAVPSKNEQVQVEAQPNPPAPSTNGKVDPQAEQTFAPNYLMPTASQSRRRPGPSLDMFRDMARQVKTPG
jgi:hypothetical protein